MEMLQSSGPPYAREFVGPNSLPATLRETTVRFASSRCEQPNLSACRNRTRACHAVVGFTLLSALTAGWNAASAQGPGGEEAASKSIDPQLPTSPSSAVPSGEVQPSEASRVQLAQIQRDIERLGANEFQTREVASAELLKIGEPALLALATAEQGADFEIRKRARAIRERIEREKQQLLALTFMRDSDASATHGLPGWKSFSSLVGTTRTAKRLFLDMIEKRRLVALSLEGIDGGSVAAGVFDGLPADPQQRLWTVIGQTCKEIRHDLYVKGERPVSGDIMALLVSVAVLDNPPQDLHDAIRSEIQFGGVERMIVQPTVRTAVRKLLGKWMLKAPVTMGEEILSIAHQTQVPEGADMARRLLANPGDKEITSKALICLARFGNAGDLDLIDKFVDDMTLLSLEPTILGDEFREERSGPPSGGPAKPSSTPPKYRRLVSDVALVAGLKIGNFDLPQHFPGIRVHDEYGVVESTIGFPVENPDVRDAAVKTWREFRSKSSQPAS